MNNKKIGVSLLVLSVILLIIFVVIIRVLNQEIEALGCFERPGCQTIETSLTIVHFAFGVFGFLFALSFYLFFFSDRPAFRKRFPPQFRERKIIYSSQRVG